MAGRAERLAAAGERARRHPGRGQRRGPGRLRRAIGRALLAVLLLGTFVAVGLTGLVLLVPYDVAGLDPARGGPLELVDREGRLLRRVPANGHQPGRRAWVRLGQIPSAAYAVVVASEDRRFFEHVGVDPLGLLRAAALDLQRGRLVYGGSTITMQLMRMMHSAGRPRSLRNKLREIVLALRAERALSKQEILEQYLNRCYYGNGAYGLEAAARRYFDKPARALSAGEATLLALVPRAPSAYNPLRHLDRLLRRREHVLALALRSGLLDRQQVARVSSETVVPRLHRPPIRAGHFTDWVLSRLPPATQRLGGRVHTTLDLALQQQLERALRRHVEQLRRHRLDQAGLVVLDTASGEVRAMIGSSDYDKQQLNITTWRRHPGSALKPFVYALALEAGDTPATLAYDIHDVPSGYRVIKPTQRERGPVSYREALAGSYNLAAVHVLERVGVQLLVGRLERAGLGPLTLAPHAYGLRLALGSAKVRLLDLAGAYGFLARAGQVTRPRGIVEVRGPRGQRWRPPRPAGDHQLFSPQIAYLVMHMLSDPEARRPMFGQELPWDLPFPLAAKTGTARGFADTVAVGVTREVTAAAWAGNFDGQPTHGLLAMRAAAPLVRAALLAAASHAERGSGTPLTLPGRPANIVAQSVCALSGQLPGPHCPHRRHELFHGDRVPDQRCNWHRRRGNQIVVAYPPVIRPWADRLRRSGGRAAHRSVGRSASTNKQAAQPLAARYLSDVRVIGSRTDASAARY